MKEIMCDTCKGDFWQVKDETTCPSCINSAKAVKAESEAKVKSKGK